MVIIVGIIVFNMAIVSTALIRNKAGGRCVVLDEFAGIYVFSGIVVDFLI